MLNPFHSEAEAERPCKKSVEKTKLDQDISSLLITLDQKLKVIEKDILSTIKEQYLSVGHHPSPLGDDSFAEYMLTISYGSSLKLPIGKSSIGMTH